MKKRQSAGDAGPLLLYAEGFGDHLESKGYSPESVRWRLRQLAALDRWLLKHRLAAGDLDAGCVDLQPVILLAAETFGDMHGDRY